MRTIATRLCSIAFIAFICVPAMAQEEGDYRTASSGDWSDAQIWESYDGAAWGATAEPPSGSETITVDSTDGVPDSVFIDVEVSISGTLVNQGIVAADDADSLLTIADGGTYQHDRDSGEMPTARWAEGSTLLMSGTFAEAPDNRQQNYYNIIFDTPELASNLNMDLDSVRIGGDILVRNTNIGRWYLFGGEPTESFTITIMGDIIVEDGAFAVQGTSDPQTTFEVHHYGNVEVTGGNFSVSRGSQPLGTTKWYLYEGDFSMDNAKTQSSTVTPQGAAFVFAKGDTQTLTLGDNIDFSALPIEVSDSTALAMGASKLGGSGHFLLNEGGAIATELPGGVAEIFADLEAPESQAMLDDSTSYAFDGTEAQITSTMMPTIVENLTIDNEAGVTLSQETTINGLLTLRAGVFDNTIPFTLGPNGEVVEEGGSLTVPVAVEEPDGAIPQAFFVEQNYPNPFNPSTTIRYGLPSPADVTIKIYNVLGQEVHTHYEGRKGAGMHEYIFDASDLSSGMYIYRIQTADQDVSKRMMLVE